MICKDAFWAIIDLGLAYYGEMEEMVVGSEFSKTEWRLESDEWGPPQWQKVGRGYDV